MVLASLAVIFAVYAVIKSQKPNQHLSAPLPDENPDFNHAELIEKIKSSPYCKELQPLSAHVKGKRVKDSMTGNSGFILILDDDTWVCSYRDGTFVGSSFGQSEPTDDIKKSINNNLYGDATDPISQNTIYADQICDIPKEVANAHGKMIECLAYGATSFNFAFVGGFELDVKLVEDKNKKPAFRVFWEQW